MAQRITERQRLAFKLESLTDTEVKEVLDYVSLMETMRRANKPAALWDDEVVALLADARENLRARQAFEWEAVRRRVERRPTAEAAVLTRL